MQIVQVPTGMTDSPFQISGVRSGSRWFAGGKTGLANRFPATSSYSAYLFSFFTGGI